MFISIIVPTRDRASSLGRTLASLAQVDVGPHQVEVLVVDNGSADRTRAVFGSIPKSGSHLGWIYIYEPMPGLLSGRHCGALKAQGDICAFLDDDVRLDKRWLVSIADSFLDPQVALAGGPSKPLYESKPPAWLDDFFCEDEHGRHCADLSLMDAGNQVREVDPRYIWGLNFSIRRDILLRLGGFNPDRIPRRLQRFQGDGETGLSLKIEKAGLKAIYNPNAAVEHEVPASRMTYEHFEQHAYYQGVCDSYTEIRANNRILQNSRTLVDSLRHIKRAAFKTFRHLKLNDLERKLANSYRAGYQFHQQEVCRDPKLLEWVLREDYWDYRLPDGWEAFCTDMSLLRETNW